MKTLLLGAACMLMTSCMYTSQSKKEGENKMEITSRMEIKPLEIVMNIHKKVKPECIEAFKVAFAKCKAETLKEEGCLDYGYYQSPEDSTEFLIYENWANDEALNKHGQTAHLKLLQEQITPMCSSSQMKKVYVHPEK